MKTAVATAALIALGLAVPSLSYAEDFNIPVPNITIGNGHQQQAEANDRGRYCNDLRRRADDLRWRADHAEYRDDARRAEDRLHEVNDQLWRDCNR